MVVWRVVSTKEGEFCVQQTACTMVLEKKFDLPMSVFSSIKQGGKSLFSIFVCFVFLLIK